MVCHVEKDTNVNKAKKWHLCSLKNIYSVDGYLAKWVQCLSESSVIFLKLGDQCFLIILHGISQV